MSDLSPRQWGKGDPEPPSLVQLRDQRGDRLIHDQGKWVFVECDGEPPEVYDSGASWAELDKLYDIEWPLTEVLPEKAAGRVLLGWDVPEHIAFSYTPGLSIGMFISCPKHAFGTLQESYLDPVERDERIGAFLKRHAHDETVDATLAVLEAAGWRPPLPLDKHGVGSLSEAIALALGDAYAGIEFEDPTFERGTNAVIEALREWEQS